MGSRRSLAVIGAAAASALAAAALVTLFVLARDNPALPGEDVAQPVADLTRQASAEALPALPQGGQRWRDHFPNVVLTTHRGDKVRFYDDLLKGKVVVLNFMYATCTGT